MSVDYLADDDAGHLAGDDNAGEAVIMVEFKVEDGADAKDARQTPGTLSASLTEKTLSPGFRE